jgi:hypothetical protein
MDKKAYYRILILALIVCIIFVKGFTFITFVSLKRITDITAENKTSLMVMKRIETSVNDVTEYNTLCLRYISSDNPGFYEAGKAKLKSCGLNLGELEQIAVQDTEEYSLIRRFTLLSRQLIAINNTTFENYHRSKIATPIRDKNFALIDSLESIVNHIETLERANLAAYEKNKLNNAQNSFILVFSFSVLAMLTFIGFIYAIKKTIDKRYDAEKDLLDLNGLLEQRVEERTHTLQSTNDSLNKSIKDLSDYKYALDQSSIVSIADTKGCISYVNDNFCNISGYSKDELVGADHRLLNSGYHKWEFMHDLWSTISKGHIWSGDIRNRSKDGEIYWVSATIVPFLDKNSRPYQYLSIINDITKRKKAESEILWNQAMLNEAQTIARMGNWDIDIQTRACKWSDEFYNLLGYGRYEIECSIEAFLDRIHPEDVSDFAQFIETSIAQGTASTFNFRLVRKDGQVRHMFGESKFEFDGQLKPIRAYGIIQDITEMKQAEEQIRFLNENLEKIVEDRTNQLTDANKSLETFTYLVSHDLRAPARAIRAFSKIIQEEYADKFDEELRTMFGHIDDCSKQLNEIIQDTLALVKHDSQKIDDAEVDMDLLVNKVWQEIAVAVPHHARLDLKALPMVKGDSSMLHQVVYNLLSNAVKYSGRKSNPLITIGFERNGDHGVFYIKDNGAGFDMKNYHRLFGAFQRLHGYSDFEGTGVGLVLVKKIVERHGGQIWADAEVDEGATFYFTLPLA